MFEISFSDERQNNNDANSLSQHYSLFKYNTFTGGQAGLKAGPKPKPRLSLLSLEQPDKDKSRSNSPGPALSAVSSNLSVGGRDRDRLSSSPEEQVRNGYNNSQQHQQQTNGNNASEERHACESPNPFYF